MPFHATSANRPVLFAYVASVGWVSHCSGYISRSECGNNTWMNIVLHSFEDKRPLWKNQRRTPILFPHQDGGRQDNLTGIWCCRRNCFLTCWCRKISLFLWDSRRYMPSSASKSRRLAAVLPLSEICISIYSKPCIHSLFNFLPIMAYMVKRCTKWIAISVHIVKPFRHNP